MTAEQPLGLCVGSPVAELQPLGLCVGSPVAEQPLGLCVQGSPVAELQPLGLCVGSPVAEQPLGLCVGSPVAELQPLGLCVGSPVAEQPLGLCVGSPVAEQPLGLCVQGSPVAELQPLGLCVQGSPVAELKSVPEDDVQGEEPIIHNQEVMVGCGDGDDHSVEHRTIDSSEEPFCRICHESGGGSGELLSPCECSGSLALVHRGCLERWLSTSNSSHCELCHHHYALERLAKPFTQWLCGASMQAQRRTLCGDMLCFLLISPLASLSGWLCVQGATELLHTNTVEAVGLLFLTLTLLTIYVFWTVVSVRFHIHLFHTWRNTDQSVRLQVLPANSTSTDSTHHHQQALSMHFFRKTANKDTIV